MLTIKPITSSNAVSYYTEKDNYYLSDKETLEKASKWMGKGAEKLGLSGVIEPDKFLTLLEGKMPNGQVLGIKIDGERKHRAGTDVTLSAPKSISLLVLVGKDKRLLDAHHKAVAMVVERIEKMAAEARVTVKGNTMFEKTFNLTIASFLHTSSRELDPQLHTHLAIMNMTERLDKQWRALSSRDKKDREHIYNGFREILYDNQHYFGLVYTSTLAKLTVEAGYDIRVTDRYGNFEVVGVDQEYIDDSSKRSSQIKARLLSKGLSSSRAAEKAALDTRIAKTEISSEELEQSWQADATKHGVNFKQIIDSSKIKDRGETISEKIIKISDTAKEAVSDALEHLSNYNAKIHHSDLVRQAFTFAGGTIHHQEIEQEITYRLQDKSLLGKENQNYTTKNLLDKEQDFQKQIIKGNGKGFSLDLNSSGVVANILKSKNRVHIVNINGLTNEKGFLEEFVHIGDENKFKTYILHQTKSHTNRLRDTISRDGSTYWRQFKNLFKDEITHTVKGFTDAYEHELANTDPSRRKDVIIIHDAQKLSYDSISKLNTLAAKSQSKVILLNNKQSTQGFFAGSPIKALVDKNISIHETRTKRQDYSCNIIKSQLPVNTISQKYSDNKKTNESKMVVVSASKKDQLALTDNIRSKLKQDGHISHQEKEIRVLSTDTLSDSQKKHTKFYKSGDFVIRNPWTKSQEKYTVLQAKDNELSVSNKEGVKSTIELTKDTDFLVKKAKDINVSVNENILLEANLYHKGHKFNKGVVGVVTAIAKDGISLEIEEKKIFLKKSLLKDAAISHAYVRRPHNVQSNFDEILISAKPYQLSSELIGELSEYSKSLNIHTNDDIKVKNKLSSETIKWTVSDAVKDNSNLVERDNSYAPAAIKEDINILIKSLSTDKFTLDKEKISKQAVNYAVAKCAERQAAFTHKELLTNALIHSMGKADFDDIAPALSERVKSGDLKYLGTHWVTQTELKIEKDILKINEENKGVMNPIISDKKTLLELDQRLTQGQKDAVVLTLSTSDRFITIQGLAGVGKTTMMREVNRKILMHEVNKLASEQNITVYGITPTNKARIELSETGIKTMTLANFLQSGNDCKHNSMFILDEASMVGSEDYKELQNKIISYDGRLVSAGDMTQLQSLSSGMPHEVNIKTQSQETAYMNNIVRQSPNPLLKEAAYIASEGNIGLSHKKISQIDPNDWLERDKEFKHNESIVEIAPIVDEETNEKNYTELYVAVANDYLSRTKECRDKTTIVIHANEDREKVNLLVRNGLQTIGEISTVEKKASRYMPKDMAMADLLKSESFKANDILRFDKTYGFIKKGDYFKVVKQVKNTNDLECVGSDGNTYVIDTKSRGVAGLSVYESKLSQLSVGEKIRFRRTDLTQGRLANDQYIVKDIDDNIATIESKSNTQSIDLSKDNDKHWDYAYTDTAYTIQGGSDSYCISLQLSFRSNSTTWRSMLIDQTRASFQHTSYTDDHKKLIDRVDNYKKQQETNKTSALLMYNSYQKSKSNIAVEQPLSESNYSQNTSNKVSKINNNLQFKEQNISIKDVEEHLKANIKGLCSHFLGEHNKQLSNSNSLRYGTKGSLKVDVQTGNWKDFESDEGGNCFELIKTQLGMNDFKDALEFAKDFLSISPQIKVIKPEIKLTSKPKDNNGFQKYARELAKESKPVSGTILEKYLKNTRGLGNIKHADIRYIDKINTYHKDKKTTVPALLAISYNDKGEVNHVQVTRLERDNPVKDMKSSILKQTYGSVNGLGVELNRNHKSKTTYLTEGIETGLSILDVKKDARVVTVLGKSNFNNIDLTRFGKDICFCLDNDGDKTFANKDINNAINKASDSGKNITIIIPKKIDTDLNDVLLNEGKSSLSSTLKATITVKEYNQRVINSNLNITMSDNKNMVKAAVISENNLKHQVERKPFEPALANKLSKEIAKDYQNKIELNTISKGIERERKL